MGLLTSAQKAAIAAGAAVRQRWYIYRPTSSGSTNFTGTEIQDDDGGPLSVVDPGSRDLSAYNVSMAEPGKLGAGLYRIVVDNSGGDFYPDGEVWKYRDYDGNLIYHASNVECRLYHYVYVLVDGAWSALSFLNYVGQINQVDYDDDAMVATITATTPSAVGLETEQEIEDYTEIEIDASGLTNPIYGGVKGSNMD